MRALLVYNICGIKKDNTNVYPVFIDEILKQDFDGELKTVVSACLPKPMTMSTLKFTYGKKLDYLVVNENLPVNITCNNAFLKGREKYGDFDVYIYMSCDSLLVNRNDIQGLCNSFKDNVGMVSAQIDQDSCYAYGLKLGGGRHVIDDENARREMFKDGKDYTVPVGRACAAHLNLYSSKIMNYYGNVIPDIFKGYCTESVFTFVCSALKLNWVISKDHRIMHNPSMDGPSSGQKAEENRSTNKHNYDHPFYGKTLLPIFQNDYAKSIGLGYEECQSVVLHDPNQFDENGHCRNELLKEYIRDNLYLTKDKFDYSKIDCKFI